MKNYASIGALALALAAPAAEGKQYCPLNDQPRFERELTQLNAEHEQFNRQYEQGIAAIIDSMDGTNLYRYSTDRIAEMCKGDQPVKTRGDNYRNTAGALFLFLGHANDGFRNFGKK